MHNGQVDMASVLTCGVHDVVYQVCEPRRGLVRQQVGEKIPGARQRQLIQTDKPHHIQQSMTCLTRVLKQTVHNAVKNVVF